MNLGATVHNFWRKFGQSHGPSLGFNVLIYWMKSLGKSFCKVPASADIWYSYGSQLPISSSIDQLSTSSNPLHPETPLPKSRLAGDQLTIFSQFPTLASSRNQSLELCDIFQRGNEQRLDLLSGVSCVGGEIGDIITDNKHCRAEKGNAKWGCCCKTCRSSREGMRP